MIFRKFLSFVGLGKQKTEFAVYFHFEIQAVNVKSMPIDLLPIDIYIVNGQSNAVFSE